MFGLDNYFLIIFEVVELRMHLLYYLILFLDSFGQVLYFSLQGICVLFCEIQLSSLILVDLLEHFLISSSFLQLYHHLIILGFPIRDLLLPQLVVFDFNWDLLYFFNHLHLLYHLRLTLPQLPNQKIILSPQLLLPL